MLMNIRPLVSEKMKVIEASYDVAKEDVVRTVAVAVKVCEMKLFCFVVVEILRMGACFNLRLLHPLVCSVRSRFRRFPPESNGNDRCN